MASGILDGRLVLTDRLQSQLGTLVSAVEIAGQNNLSSSHVVAETTLAGLLNRVYGWELVNANAIRQNCPGIDLIDAGDPNVSGVNMRDNAWKTQYSNDAYHLKNNGMEIMAGNMLPRLWESFINAREEAN